MLLLRQRLQRAGYRVYQFSYLSVEREIGENAARLNDFVARCKGETLHFVAHSLGGLVVRRMLYDFPTQRPGRIVTIGSPHTGSYVADRLSRSGLMRKLLGASLRPLTGHIPEWDGVRELGSIAGTLSIGVGWLMHDLPSPNDGTVAVEETRLGNMTEHHTVHASHMAMLFSRQVASLTTRFLRHGTFSHS